MNANFALFFILFVAVAEQGNAASIGSIAQDIRSDRIDLNGNLAAALPDVPKSNEVDFGRLSVPLGGALDLFYRYGFFSLSVRVVPREDPGAWLVREPTVSVFEPSSMRTMARPGPNSFAQQPFEISLCDDVEELKEAFFRGFTAEGIAQPHKLYTGSWRIQNFAKYLGISIDVLNGESTFVLVRLTKNSGTMEVNGNLRLSPGPAQASGSVRAGDSDSVLKFVEKYGTHYLQSVTIGDSIYQVLALTKESMDELKRFLGVGRLASINIDQWMRAYDAYLAPWKVQETGNVKVASGDFELQRFAEKELRFQAQFGSYASLVGSLIGNPALVRQLQGLSSRASNAIVGAHFASLKPFVGNGNAPAMEFYEEVVSTNSALWEANL